MKKILLCSFSVSILFFHVSSIQGQWVLMNGPAGGSISSFASQNGRLYAGTSDGVFYTTNNGKEWISAGLNDTAVIALVSSNGNLIAGTPLSGTFLSSDGGAHWDTVISALSANVYALISSGSNVFAGSISRGVFFSTNSGRTWVTVNTGLPNYYGIKINALAMINQVIFAGTDSGVYSTANNGTLWTPMNTGLPPTSTGRHIHALLSLGTELYAGADSGGVYQSTNSGLSWTTSNSGLPNKDVLTLSFIFAESGFLFAGTRGGGIYKSADGHNWAAANNGLNGMLVQTIDSLNGNLFAGTAGYGVFLSSDVGANWHVINTGLNDMGVGEIVWNNGTLFAGSYGGGVGANGFSGGVFASTDLGSTWTISSNGMTTSSGFNPPLNAFTSVNGNLYAGSVGNGIYRSTDNGGNWTQLNNGLVNISIQAISGTNNWVFLSSLSGVYRSSNNGDQWLACDTGLYGNAKFVSSLLANGSDLFAGTEVSGMYLSNDNAASWTVVNTGFPCASCFYAAYVHSIADLGGNIFISTDSGIFRSSDNGGHWVASNNGLPNIRTTALDTAGGNLFVGTHGSGVFISKDNGAHWNQINEGLTDFGGAPYGSAGGYIYFASFGGKLWRRPLTDFTAGVRESSVTSLEIHAYPNPATDVATFGFTLARSSQVIVRITNSMGDVAATFTQSRLETGEHYITFNVQSLPAGIYFYQVSAGGETRSGKIIVSK